MEYLDSMHIPILYDIVWFLTPALWIFLAIIVGISESRAQHPGKRLAFWVALQLILPFIGFVAWLFKRWLDSRGGFLGRSNPES